MQLTETENTEYKRRVTGDIEKTVIGFLNTSGGELHIGIDPDGSVYGVDNYDEVIREFSDRIKNNISPSVLGLFSVSPKMGSNGKIYLIVKIASGSEKPYYLKEFGMSPKGCFMRVGTQTIQMPQSTIDTLYARRSLHTLRNITSPNQSLKFEQLKIYYSEKGFEVNNDHFLENLDFYTDDGKFNYLAYLMADTNGISIKIAQYADTDKIVILQKTECGHCSLVRAAHSMLMALDMYNKTAVELTYLKRIDTRLVDTTALHEAVINTLVHNDYIRGSYPVVEFYPDRVEVTSSGGLPLGLTKEEFFKGKSHQRNREIMRIFKDMDLCEQLGSGMKRIMKVYKPEDYEISENFVVANFKYNEHALAILNGSEKFLGSSEKIPRNSLRDSKEFAELSTTNKRIIELIECDGTITTNVMAASIGLTDRAIRKNIKRLKGAGIIERVGADRGGYWKIIR